MPIRPVSGLSLYFGWFGHGFGSLFLELLRCWRHRRRFCGKKQATAPPAEEETPAEPVTGGGAEGNEQSEAHEPPQEEEAARAPSKQPQGVKQGENDDTWDDFE